MNALLLHGNNLNPETINGFTGKIQALDYSHSIQRSNFRLDGFLHEELSAAFEQKEYKVIFIPYTLSKQNYLELTGLRVAAHIRITKSFNHQFVSIVFIGPESPEQIARLSDLGSLLFTPGIFSTSTQNIKSLEEQYEWIIKNKPKITKLEIERCYDRLQLSPPGNYQSHHSIDNELALFRWAEYLRCDDQIPEIKENLQTGLYFKYHRVLNPVIPPGSGNTYMISGKGKVLLIDDESKKGWSDFYKCFFKNNINNGSIEFKALNADFQSLSQQEIVEAAKKEVVQYDADVVLLDLRLSDVDFTINLQTDPKELTGYKILQELKIINKGIQVIITTASNKVWNFQSTYEHSNGYIIKRSDSDVAEDIKNLKKTVESCVLRVSYLKPAYHLVNSLTTNLDKAIKEKRIDKNFGREFSKLLDLSYKMYDTAFTKDDFAYAYLALFKSLELISDEFTLIDSGVWQVVGPHPLNQYVWDSHKNCYKSNQPTAFRNNVPSTFEKIAGLCFQLWCYNQADIQQLYFSIKRRNEFIHPSESQLPTNLRTECNKVFTHEGYAILLKQLFKIGNKILT